MHPIEKARGAWKNGNYGEYSAIAYAFAHKLLEELDVPIGILNGSFSETSIQAWTPRIGFCDGKDEYTQKIYQRILETDPATPEHKAAWERYYQELEDGIAENAARIARGEPAVEVSGKRPGNLNGNRDASWMFNGRINPLVPYAIRGAIWNQGYANMGEGLYYYNNLHSLIRGWRLVWNRPELPVYFHQFYTPGNSASPHPTVGGTSEMRLGTVMARDIPHTGMASQIDVGGSIHYFNKAVPGQRLALHALKNQYPSTMLRAGGRAGDMVADGPIFKSYEVQGDRLMVSFDHAEGGLVVANPNPRGLLTPEIIENGEDQVQLFYLADADRVWHPARARIAGDTVVLTAEGVRAPRGVSYAAGGVSFQPNLYNRALLPTSPFIYYDHELVLASTWPDTPIKIAGVEPDLSRHGLPWAYRRMPLLSTQFRESAVLQAGVPVTIWGGLGPGAWIGAQHEGVLTFRFAPTAGPEAAAIEKTIPVTPGMNEWQVVLPPMEAGEKAYTLKVTFSIEGELVHERTAEGIVFGDVFYVAAPAGKFAIPDVQPAGGIVRVMERKSKRDRHGSESRFSVAVSTQEDNRFASLWRDAESGLAAALGHRIAAKTGHPVGIVFMQSGTVDLELNSWIPIQDLNRTPSLLQDYQILASMHPWGPGYNDSIRQYIADYKSFWGAYIPQMIETKAGKGWGSIPSRRPAFEGSSQASQSWNVMTCSFTPAALKGIVFLAGPGQVARDEGANFGPALAVLAHSWKARFGGEDARFIYTIPGKTLAPKISKPEKIEGHSLAIELADWNDVSGLMDAIVGAFGS